MTQSTLQSAKKGFRLAIVGHRGIPNTYGGFETFAEKVAESLVGLGTRVVVYCRAHYFASRPAEHRGAKLVYLPALHKKSLETFFHTLLSVLHIVLFNTADTVLVVNVGNAPSALLAKLLRKKVIFCVDGLDWQRRKWGSFARLYLKTCSYFAKYVAHTIVTDAASVMEFYASERNTKSVMIPYGTEFDTSKDDVELLKEFGLTSKKYFLFAARFEPEYNPLLVVRAHAASGSTLPLVMVGDNRYNPELVREVKAAAGKNVLFLGYVFGRTYKTLMREALCYIRAAEVGGFSPAVVEAMGRATCVIAADRAENREPLADTGVYFDFTENSLAEALRTVSANPDDAILRGKQAAQRAMLMYSWDTIGFEYFKLVKQLSLRASHTQPATLAEPATNAKKKILITGSGGMLGRAAYERFSKSYTVLATSRTAYESWMQPLDVTDFAAFEAKVAAFKPDYIFHFAALTSLESCEKHLAEAYAVNTMSVKYAAQLASKYGATIVYPSTSGVFDGHAAFFTERDEPHPITVYGLTKQMGALMVEYYAEKHLIIRPSWLMGGGAHCDKKFVGKLIEQILSGQRELFALGDTFGTLTYSADVMRVLSSLIDMGSTGLYNTAGIGRASRYDIAREIVHILGYENEIIVHPVDRHYFKTTYFTKRAPSECLVNERLNREMVNTMRPWQVALRDYLEREYGYAFNPNPAPAASADHGLMVRPA